MFKSMRTCAVLATAALGLSFAARPAHASDPFPNDAIAPPPNINVFLLYNQFQNSGTVVTTNGTELSHTHISTVVNTARLIHTFDIDNYIAGVGVYLPIVNFVGTQKIGGTTVRSNSGFSQPNFSAFFWPINNPSTGTYVVTSAWISPPVSSFNKIDTLPEPTLTPANNAMFEEIEVGAHQRVYGTQTTPNVSLEAWSTTYFHQNNSNYAATYVPTRFGLYGPLDATLRQQPTEEMRFYVTYMFDPQFNAFGTVGFFQSFGGKETLKIAGVPGYTDTGVRTNESQLRFDLSSFVSRTTQFSLYVYTDVAAHGGPKQHLVGVRFTKLF